LRSLRGRKLYISHIVSYLLIDFDVGFKHLGFHLKYNLYLKGDWKWLIAKVEKNIKIWCNIWLSHGGRLVLVKYVLEAITVFWMSLT
jgi:hypothetical protein